MSTNVPPTVITPELCEAFHSAAEELAKGRIGNVPEESMDAFVRLRWIEQRAGAPCITTLGQMALLSERTRRGNALSEH